jgi:hypothetical protein
MLPRPLLSSCSLLSPLLLFCPCFSPSRPLTN